MAARFNGGATMKHWLLIWMSLSVLLWGMVGWKTLAAVSGRLGPVSLTWHPVNQASAFMSWSPGAAGYTFDHGDLRLNPGQSATFKLKTSLRFRNLHLKLISSGPMTLSVPSNLTSQGDLFVAVADLPIRWPSSLVSVTNPGATGLTVKKIILQLQP